MYSVVGDSWYEFAWLNLFTTLAKCSICSSSAHSSSALIRNLNNYLLLIFILWIKLKLRCCCCCCFSLTLLRKRNMKVPWWSSVHRCLGMTRIKKYLLFSFVFCFLNLFVWLQTRCLLRTKSEIWPEENREHSESQQTISAWEWIRYWIQRWCSCWCNWYYDHKRGSFPKKQVYDDRLFEVLQIRLPYFWGVVCCYTRVHFLSCYTFIG